MMNLEFKNKIIAYMGELQTIEDNTIILDLRKLKSGNYNLILKDSEKPVKNIKFTKK